MVYRGKWLVKGLYYNIGIKKKPIETIKKYEGRIQRMDDESSKQNASIQKDHYSDIDEKIKFRKSEDVLAFLVEESKLGRYY